MLRHGKMKCPSHRSYRCPICGGAGIVPVTWWDEVLEDEVREFDAQIWRARRANEVRALYRAVKKARMAPRFWDGGPVLW